jgi:hypothetical protein
MEEKVKQGFKKSIETKVYRAMNAYMSQTEEER